MQPTYNVISGKPDEVKKVYFFTREDGTYFYTDARDAWNILKGRNQIAGVRTPVVKLVGTSDGRFFPVAVERAKQVQQESGIDAAKEFLRKEIDAEFERSKEHMEIPPNADTVNRRGSVVDINKIR